MGKVIGFIACFCGLWLIITAINTPKAGANELNARQTFDLINQDRLGQGIPALIWSDELEKLALQHSYFMATTGNFTHSQYPYSECIAAGENKAQSLYELWRDSPRHNAIMMSSEFRYGAIAIYQVQDDIKIKDKRIITYNINSPYATLLVD